MTDALRRAVVIGGAGAVGDLFVRSLTGAGIAVTVLDRDERAARPGVRFLHGDASDPGPDARAGTRSADAVVLALPEQVAIRALPAVLDTLAPGAVLVDTLSVKGPYASALATASAGGRHGLVQAVGLNPMFAPSLGFTGRPVAAVVYGDGARTRRVLDLVRSWGARVVPCDAGRHDRLCAASQALTHAAVLAFGVALSELDVAPADLADLAPPPHAALLALLARMTGLAPEVYWDVQAANPHAGAARDALGRALGTLSGIVRSGDEEAFGRLLRSVGSYLGDELPRHRATCEHLFTGLAAASPPSASPPSASPPSVLPPSGHPA